MKPKSLHIVLIAAAISLSAVPAGQAQEVELVDPNEVRVSIPAPLTQWGAPKVLLPEVVLYDNGPLVNCPGCGAGGADESQVQNASLAMSTIGFGHQFALGNSIADDFTVTDATGWQIDTITFFAYQTGSTTTSTITGVYVQIWDGDPSAGGSVVWGDLTTNRLIFTEWSNTYRVNETSSGTTNRPIMANVAAIGTILAQGTYWVQWTTDGSPSLPGPWAPPITITGLTTTGNALQFTTAWAPAIDTGTGAPQGLPFLIEGSVLSACTPVPDDGYDGTLASMTCRTLLQPWSVWINQVGVNLSVDHTFVGDMTFKVVNPRSQVLTLMSRPGFAEPADDGTGCCGHSADMSSAFPVSFLDPSVNDAEELGAPGGVVCQGDGICDYFPNPDTGPGTDLSDFIGWTPAGDWMVCVGDAGGLDTGELCDAVIFVSIDPSVIFADGFESGDMSFWSQSVP